ncbi:MAG: nucleoside transporter C-terminal domain-containing protein [Clostridium sp.]
MNIFFGILCLAVIIGIAFLLSDSKKNIKWRTVVVGLIGQFILIFFVMKVPLGQKILEVMVFGVDSIVKFGMEGVAFVFGDLATNTFIFAVSVLALIVFTSALISVLYFLKIIPFFVRILGRAIARVMGTTEVETFSAIGNSFLGGTEAPLLIRPYIKSLTSSELFAVVSAGFGSASAAILAGYSVIGIDMRYLLIAVFTVPFSCLMISKVIKPETEVSLIEKGATVQGCDYANVFDAIGDGAITGKDLAINVGAMLIAFLGLIALINGILSVFSLSLSTVLGWIFSPVGYLMNIPRGEITTFASLIGIKTAINEFVAYSDLVKVMGNLSPRTVAILSVSICNFANIGTIGIQIGGFGVLAPERRSEVAKIGLKALLVGLLATLTTGAIVGMMF